MSSCSMWVNTENAQMTSTVASATSNVSSVWCNSRTSQPLQPAWAAKPRARAGEERRGDVDADVAAAIQVGHRVHAHAAVAASEVEQGRIRRQPEPADSVALDLAHCVVVAATDTIGLGRSGVRLVQRLVRAVGGYRAGGVGN